MKFYLFIFFNLEMTNGTTQAELLLFQTIGPMSIILRNITLPGLLYIFPNILQIGIWLVFDKIFHKSINLCFFF